MVTIQITVWRQNITELTPCKPTNLPKQQKWQPTSQVTQSAYILDLLLK